MGNSIRTLAVVSTVVAGLAAASALYADETDGPGGSTMGRGMTGQGGMMGMMRRMSAMMETCNEMMQSVDRGGSRRPNEQWRKDAAEAGERPGTNG